MFGRRQQQQTHRQQFMDEFNQGVGALRRAAGHFALGTAERLSPTYDRARSAAGRGWDSTRDRLNPMYHSMREGAAQSRSGRMPMASAMDRRLANTGGWQTGFGLWGRQETVNRMNKGRLTGLASLLAAGAAVGAAGAAVARRRRQDAEWEEYDPMTGETRYYGGRSAYGDESAYGHRSTRERVASGAASMVDSLTNRAGRIADTLHERSAAMHEPAQERPTMEPGAHTMPEPVPPRTTGPAGDFAGRPPTNPPMGTGSGVPGTTPMPPGNPLHGPGAPLAFPDEP